MRTFNKKLIRLYDTFRGKNNVYNHAHSLVYQLGKYDDEKSSMTRDNRSMTNLIHKSYPFVSMSLSNRQLKCTAMHTLVNYQNVRFKSDMTKFDPKLENKPIKSDQDNKDKRSLIGLMRKYGWTFFGTYMSIYVTTLVSLYISIDAGYLDPSTIANIDLPWHSSAGRAAQDADVRDIKTTAEFVGSYLEKFSWTKPYAPFVMNNPRTTNLALAWIATKLTEPIRLGVTLAILPSVSRFVAENTSSTNRKGPMKEGEQDGTFKK